MLSSIKGADFEEGVSEPTRVGLNLGRPQGVLDLQVCKGLGLSSLWGPQETECTKDLLREGIRKILIRNFLSHSAISCWF